MCPTRNVHGREKELRTPGGSGTGGRGGGRVGKRGRVGVEGGCSERTEATG